MSMRLSEPIVEVLVRSIVSGAFPAGSALPTEPELGGQFGVSRTVVREAVQAVEAMRLLEVRQGHGTRVRPRADWDLLHPRVLAARIRDDADLTVAAEVNEIRVALESRMARRAAERADAITVAGLREELSRTGNDSRFHEIVAAASGNLLGQALVALLRDHLPQDCRRDDEHRAIVEAIAAHDPERAGDTMAAHVQLVWERIHPR